MADGRRFSRREFNKIALGVLGGVAGAVTGVLTPEDNSPFTSQLQRIDSPADVARHFQHASSGELMAAYSVFFPAFLTGNFRGPEQLESAAARQKLKDPKDPHRLDALPAVAAAHLLAQASPATQVVLSHRLAQALQDPRREVLEVVLQNLLTSITPDYDTLGNYDVATPILEAGARLLETARWSPKLASPVSLYIQYLLTARKVMQVWGREREAIASIEGILTRFHNDPRLPPHLWHAQKLIDLYETIPPPTLGDAASILPQASEALMGWQQLEGRYGRPILEHFAVGKVQTLFAVWATAIGEDQSDPEIMDVRSSLRAMEKMIAFERSCKTLPLMRPLLEDPSVLPGRRLQKFVRSEYQHLIERHELAEEFESSLGKDVALGSRVPFAANDERLIPWTAWKHSQEESFFNWMDLLLKIGGGIGVGEGLWQAIEVMGKVVSPRALTGIDVRAELEVEELQENVVQHCEEVEVITGERLDEVDLRLGIVNIDKAGNLEINGNVD